MLHTSFRSMAVRSDFFAANMASRSVTFIPTAALPCFCALAFALTSSLGLQRFGFFLHSFYNNPIVSVNTILANNTCLP